MTNPETNGAKTLESEVNAAAQEAKRPGMVKRFFQWLGRPSKTTALGTLLIGGFILGILFWGGFHWAVESTNTEKFCVSCHSMTHNYDEYVNTIHYTNRTGVRAVCTDCHVPKEWGHKMVAKIMASKDVYAELMGTINTKQKYEDRRLEMAKAVWRKMKSTDSRECRNCHNFSVMDLASQETRAANIHQEAFKTPGTTCIDCHKGLAHRLPAGAEAGAAEIDKELGRKPFVMQQIVGQ